MDSVRHGKSEDEMLDEFLASLTPEERLRGLSPQQRLAGLSLEQRLAGLSLEQRLAGLLPEQRLAELSVLALPDDLLRSVSAERLATFPAHVQEAVRKRLGTAS